MKKIEKDLTLEEVVIKKNELQETYRKLRFDKVMGQLDNPVELRNVRRGLAKLNTIVHEYKLGIRKA